MREESIEKLFRLCAILIVMTILAGGLVTAWPAYLRRRMLHTREAELERCIEEKKREIAVLVESQRRFKTDPDFVETIARQNHRVFPGELVFIFEN